MVSRLTVIRQMPRAVANWSRVRRGEGVLVRVFI